MTLIKEPCVFQGRDCDYATMLTALACSPSNRSVLCTTAHHTPLIARIFYPLAYPRAVSAALLLPIELLRGGNLMTRTPPLRRRHTRLTFFLLRAHTWLPHGMIVLRCVLVRGCPWLGFYTWLVGLNLALSLGV